jgi:hypothetical protein
MRCSKLTRTSAALAMSPILLGTIVTSWRVVQRSRRRAKPRSPRQRRERSRALRVRVSMSSPGAVAGLLDRDVHALTCAFVAGIGQQRQCALPRAQLAAGAGATAPPRSGGVHRGRRAWHDRGSRGLRIEVILVGTSYRGLRATSSRHTASPCNRLRALIVTNVWFRLAVLAEKTSLSAAYQQPAGRGPPARAWGADGLDGSFNDSGCRATNRPRPG